MKNKLFRFLFLCFFHFGSLFSMHQQIEESFNGLHYMEEKYDPNYIKFTNKNSLEELIAFFNAIEKDSVEHFIELMKNNLNLFNRDIIIRDNSIIKVISYICMQGSFEILKFALENGVDANYMDKNGKTLLHYALSCANNDKKLHMVKLLIKKGSNPNIFTQDIHENSPLHIALFYGSSIQVIEELLKAKANPNVPSKTMMTPIYFIDDYNQLCLLLKYGAYVNPFIYSILKDNGITEEQLQTLYESYKENFLH